MGTLFSTFAIARSGLHAAQVQLDIAAHNIANVNREGFSRQRAELVTFSPLDFPFGQIGRGVRVARISRMRDPLLDALFRRQVDGLQQSQIRADFFNQIEDVFLEPGENGLSGRLNRFFDSLSEYANNVEELPVRQSVITEADALVALFRETAERLNILRTSANEEAINFVPQINSLASRIAALNQQIRIGENSGQPANDLRDERDLLLDELAGIINISVFEGEDGMVSIIVGDTQLISGTDFRAVEAVPNAALDPERNDLVEIRYADNGELLGVTSGELFGALQMRDVTLVDVDSRIDTLAATIIRQINLIHSQGNGLVNYSGTVLSSNLPTDAVTAFSSAGLPFPIANGTFDFNVYDSTGAIVASATIAVDPSTDTLTTLAAALNGVSGNVGVTVTGSNELSITAASGFSFAFANDTSGVLAALGVNGLFTGFDARTMGLNQAIVNDPRLLASGFSTDPLATGDNTAALAMANVRNLQVLNGNSTTINGFYEETIVNVGIGAQANRQNLEIEQTFIESFRRRRQEISGVSLDEEVTMLLQYQRAFEASARLVTTTDRMLESLLTMAL